VQEGQATSGVSLSRKLDTIQDNIKAKVDTDLSVGKEAPHPIQGNMGVILKRTDAKMDTPISTGQEAIQAI
jgi:hypothetical protein